MLAKRVSKARHLVLLRNPFATFPKKELPQGLIGTVINVTLPS
jgi:hypothetical protein